MSEFVLDEIRLRLPDDLIGRGIDARINEGCYETAEAQAVRARVKPGMRVLEIGAGLGFVSSVCATCAGAEHVVSIEANPNMVPVARGNLDLNGFSQVRLLHGVVTDGDIATETMPFHAGKAFWGGAMLGKDESHPDAVDVPVLRLRDLLDLHRPEFVMMDIEGGEQHLFSQKWPRFVRFVVLELHPNKYPDAMIRQIVDCMSKSGLTYDPATSQGRVLGFRRIRKKRS